MTRGLSLWLDTLRVVAALVVVLSHLAYPRFTGGDLGILRELNAGPDAVVVFFVISGLVIAHAAARAGGPSRYAFDRLTRLLSVLLPALLLTAAFDAIGVRIDPDAYPAEFHNPLPLWEMLARGLSLTSEWAIPGRVRLGSNGPLWSVSYEAAYYLLIGIAVFSTGARRLLLLAIVAVLVGLPVLLLMPAWLLGVWLHRLLRQPRAIRLGRVPALIFAAGAPACYALGVAAGVPALLGAITAAVLPGPAAGLGFSAAFLWHGVVGLLTVAHLLGIARLLAGPVRERRSIRWAAGATFSIYVTHYPALQLLDAVLPEAVIGRGWLLLAGSLAVGLVFAALFERRLPVLRAALRAGLARLRPDGAGHANGAGRRAAPTSPARPAAAGST